MTQELYIDGQRVDMLNDVVALQYRSNLFGDISKITSSNSLTIALPKTPNNNMVMKFSDLPYSNGLSRRWYDAVYCRDGVQMINGKAKLLSADSESYEVALIWGVVAQLSDWLDADLKLRDLNIRLVSKVEENSVDNCLKTRSVSGVYYYNNGGEQYLLPVISAGYIFKNALGSALLGSVDISEIDTSYIDNLFITLPTDLLQEVGTGSFYIVNYLPDMKVIDFVKAMCYIMGWYFESVGGQLKIISFDALSDTSRIIDWSDKLISSDVPDAVEFNFNDSARKNWMRYKTDDNVTINADGYIATDDTTLEQDKTLVTLPFAPTDDGNYIRQYETTIDENGEASTAFVKTEPRILGINPDGPLDSNGDPIPELYFLDTQYFSQIISANYNYLSAVMLRPTVIEARLRLSDFDLLSLDYTRPVYISQYGGNYGIIELTNQGDISTAKLIKLP